MPIHKGIFLGKVLYRKELFRYFIFRKFPKNTYRYAIMTRCVDRQES